MPWSHWCTLTPQFLQPTNHLDIEGLDALMKALQNWNGGVIVISHDERFITSVAKEVRCSALLLENGNRTTRTALGLR